MKPLLRSFGRPTLLRREAMKLLGELQAEAMGFWQKHVVQTVSLICVVVNTVPRYRGSQVEGLVAFGWKKMEVRASRG